MVFLACRRSADALSNGTSGIRFDEARTTLLQPRLACTGDGMKRRAVLAVYAVVFHCTRIRRHAALMSYACIRRRAGPSSHPWPTGRHPWRQRWRPVPIQAHAIASWAADRGCLRRCSRHAAVCFEAHVGPVSARTAPVHRASLSTQTT